MRRWKNARKPPDQPGRLLPIKKYSEQLPVSPRSGGEDRYRLDPQGRIKKKIKSKERANIKA